jgi:hypothetical protein
MHFGILRRRQRLRCSTSSIDLTNVTKSPFRRAVGRGIFIGRRLVDSSLEQYSVRSERTGATATEIKSSPKVRAPDLAGAHLMIANSFEYTYSD